MKPVLVFDYDGTLHETMRVYKPGIEGAVHWLRREQGIDVSIPSDQRIQSWLGMNTADMWEDFMPGLPASLRQQAGKLVGEIMLGEIRAGHARWYPGVTWNLDSLKHEGYTMVVLSNCEREYAELNWEVFGMERWFDAFYDCASYGYIPKEEIMKLVAAHYVEKSSEHKAEFVVIGDRGSDYAAAQSVGAPFIWCAYGYGSREEFVRETENRPLSPRREEMIEPEMARRFIEQVTQYTEYNINIMDESGVIIASRDPKRVGTYHEVADRIIRGTQDMIVIRDDKMFPGVLPGINMAIIHEGRREGVVGVTGDPDKIHDVALITRMAMEAMLKYEKQQEQIRLRRSRKEHFISLLTQSEFASATEIRGIAGQLEYDESRVRVPILCRMYREAGDPPEPEQVLEVMRRSRGHWVQDFSYVMDETHLLVFKTVKVDGRRNMVDYREEIEDYLEDVLKWLKSRDVRAVFYVGTLQNSFSQYFYAYRHCKWLESHMRHPGDIVFFTDYVKEYFRTLTPRQELHRIFNVYDSETPDEKKQQFVEMIKALEETNYNLSEAAGKLYIHKNTLVYRYNRMKDYLGVDPLLNMEGREFLGLLLMYLAQKR